MQYPLVLKTFFFKTNYAELKKDICIVHNLNRYVKENKCIYFITFFNDVKIKTRIKGISVSNEKMNFINDIEKNLPLLYKLKTF